MATNSKSVLGTGSYGAYQWLTVSGYRLSALLRGCPQAVLNKFIAVASLDSGPLVLNEGEIAAGWESRNGIAYSPRVQSLENLPHEGYDEWYVFESPADLGGLFQGNLLKGELTTTGHVAAFVSYGGFGFHNPAMQTLVDLFWMQLETIHPESVIADGDLLNFVCLDQELFAAVRNVLT